MKTKLMQLADALVRANQAVYKDETHKEAEGINLASAALEAEIDRVCKDAAKPPAVLMNQLVNDKLELSAKLAERDAEIERITKAYVAELDTLSNRNYALRMENAAQRKVLEESRRELHACQAVIHLHGGFDPAYVTGAQSALKNIDQVLEVKS